jgi:ABC-2 type transport system permease protein
MSVTTAMSATTTTAVPPAAVRSSSLRRLTITELKLATRDRVSPIWGGAFPLVLLVIFGAIPSFRKPMASLGGYTPLDVYVPILIAFAIAISAAVVMPMLLAGYRERGVLRRLQTTPAGPYRVLAAHLIINLALAAVSVTEIVVVARFGYGVFLPRQLAGFVLAVLFTAAALLALGLFIAAIAPSARAAQVIGMLLFYPMLFFSGMWWPIPLMPPVLQHVAEATPLGATWQAMSNAAAGHWPPALPLATLAAYAVVLSLAAARLFRWE